MGKITSYPSLDSYQLTGDEYLLLETGAGTRNATVNALVDNLKNALPETPTEEDYEELKEATTIEKDGEKIPLKEVVSQHSESNVKILGVLSKVVGVLEEAIYGKDMTSAIAQIKDILSNEDIPDEPIGQPVSVTWSGTTARFSNLRSTGITWSGTTAKIGA